MSNFFKKVLQSITVQSVQGYDFDGQAAITQGQWKIYNGKHKQKVGSVWICDSKHNQQAKKEYTSLIKLKYPAILNVVEALVDEKSHIAFVTERIECTLQQALNDPKFQISDIEIKLHLLELVDGVQFLHNNVRQVHLDISPDKIYITENGRWKIGGSAFQQQVLSTVADCPSINFYDKQQCPNLNYAAPELLQSQSQCAYASDIYSLGMVILKLLKYKHNTINLPEFTQAEQYKQFASQLSTEIMKYTQYIPESFLKVLSTMLSTQTTIRPNLSQFIQVEWFKDPYLIAFNILNKLPELDQQQQIVFFKGLSTIIFTFEKSILKKRLLPSVLGLTNFDHLLTPVIQIILEMMRREDILNAQQFQADVWPKLKAILSGKEIPAQVLYDTVLGIPIFHKYITQKDLQDILVPLLIKCYECKVFKLQDLALRVTEFIIEHNDYTFTKTKILPRVFALCSDTNIDVRKTTLICIYKLLNVMEAELVLAHLEKVKQLGTNREINQVVLKIYQSLSKTLSSDFIATKLLPQVTPYLTDTTLSKVEFNEYYDTLLQLLHKIKEEKEKNLSDGDKGVVAVDYKLSLPEPKRINEAKQDKFEFLTAFDSGIQNVPEKPLIIQQQPQVQQGIPLPTMGIPVSSNSSVDPFGQLFQSTQPYQVQPQPQQSTYQVQPQQQPQQQINMQQQPIQQQQQQVQTSQLYQQTTSNPMATYSTNLYNQQLPQQTTPIVTQSFPMPSNPIVGLNQPIINEWSNFNEVKEAKPFQDMKKLSSRPMFGNSSTTQSQPKAIDPFAPKQSTSDPWAQFNQPATQDIWNQQVINQPNNLNQNNQVNSNNNTKNKYASFDELI